MKMTDEQYEEIYADVRALLSEHFPMFMYVVMDDDGGIFYDYTNVPVGKMLAREMMEDMGHDPIDIDWDYEHEEVEGSGEDDEWEE